MAKTLGGIGAGLATYFGPLFDQVKAAGERQAAAEQAASADEEVAEKAKELGQTMAQAEAAIASNMHEWGVDADTAAKMYTSGMYDDVPASPAKAAAPAAPKGVGGEDGAVVAAILAAVAQQCGPNAKVTSITKCK